MNDRTELFAQETRLIDVTKQLRLLGTGHPARPQLQEEIAAICERLDELEPIDFGDRIKRLVRWLQAHNFDPTMREDEQDGHIVLVADPSEAVGEAIRLRELLKQHGVNVVPYGSEPNGTVVLQSFDAADGSAIIEILGADDATLFGDG